MAHEATMPKMTASAPEHAPATANAAGPAQTAPLLDSAAGLVPMDAYHYADSTVSRHFASRAASPSLIGGAAAAPAGASHHDGSRAVAATHACAPSPVNRTGLPDDLKIGVETLSGVSLDDVKVHYRSSRPAQLHAHAYACGREIHLAPGQEQHLPHEAWHLVQQAQGRVAPTVEYVGVTMNDDGGLEREADKMGVRAGRLGTAKRSYAPTPQAGMAKTGSTMRAHAPLPTTSVVQAKLTLGKTVVAPGEVEALVDGLPKEITDETLKEDYETYLATHRDHLLHVVGKWAAAPEHKSIKGSYAKPPAKAPKAKVRAYDDADSLAFATLAEAHSKQKKTDEKAYAQEIVSDASIFNELADLIERQIPAALGTYKKTVDDIGKLTPSNRRTYLEYVRASGATTIEHVLKHPRSYTFGELVAAIHDVQELLYQTKNEELLPTFKDEQTRNLNNPHALPPERYAGSVFVGISPESSGLPVLERTSVDRSWRGKDATPRPSNPHVRTAMLLGNPSDMGPSMTAARMFVLATHGGASPDRVKALALALFAFWNRIYRRDITDVHRYHFTMDMAANFGVSYSPFTPIDKKSREEQEEFNLREVESEFDVWD
jgi:Domain of unknown function (DUF4157)